MIGLIAAAAFATSAPAVKPSSIGRWRREIAEASVRFAIPVSWIASVMRAESAGVATRQGKPTISPAGAIGLMQLMPSTWSEMRAALSLGADPADPHDNILAGTGYLRLMYERFGYPGLFGAYNAGPQRYARYLAGAAKLPSETVAYLAKTAGGGRGISRIAVQRLAVQRSVRSAALDLFVTRRHSLPRQGPGDQSRGRSGAHRSRRQPPMASAERPGPLEPARPGKRAQPGKGGSLVGAPRRSTQQNGAKAGKQLVARDLDVQPTLVALGPVCPGLLEQDLLLPPWRG